MYKATTCLAAAVLAALIICGCGGGPYVWVKQDSFSFKTDEMADDLGLYRGTSVFLKSFHNQAPDTSTFYFYSPDGQVTYEGAPTLHSFLWYCFQKSLRHVGVAVYEHEAPPGVPELHLVMKSLTDRKFQFEVVMVRSGLELFRGTFKTLGRPPASKDPQKLEQAVYRMVQDAVLTVLEDSDFQEAFFGGDEDEE